MNHMKCYLLGTVTSKVYLEFWRDVSMFVFSLKSVLTRKSVQ